MRIMIDTNVLFSAFVLSSPHMLKLIDTISENHTIVLPTYVLDELKRVAKEKFPECCHLVEKFLRELPFELVYTPETLNPKNYPVIQDLKDLPILVSAIDEDVDVLISGDAGFSEIEIEYPEFLTPREFVDKYLH